MKANNTKLQESITLQRRVIAGYEKTISENKTRRAYFIALNDYKQAAKMEQIINRDEQDLNELKQQLNEMETELNTTDNTPTTMNANETKAPGFSELSHAATNIALAAENTASLYEKHVEPLLRSLERKAAKGVTLSLDTLAKSYAMAAIIRESIKEVKRTSYDPFSANKDDRRAAALYLANIYIGDL